MVDYAKLQKVMAAIVVANLGALEELGEPILGVVTMALLPDGKIMVAGALNALGFRVLEQEGPGAIKSWLQAIPPPEPVKLDS